MTFFRREGENPMKHFGSYLTVAWTVPYLLAAVINCAGKQRKQGNLHWGGIQRLFIIRTGSTGANKKYKVMRPQVHISLTT